MTIEELAIACGKHVTNGQKISLTFPAGKPARMKGWPRGELLCVNPSGDRTFSFDPLKILLALHKARLVTIQLTDNGKPV